jgi:two-component system cell cycle sensor histidine kinase/response regulator CckA
MSEPSAQGDVALMLSELRRRFVGQLASRIAALRSPLQQMIRLGGVHDDIEKLHREVHGLTGAAGTFGLPGVSVAARELENLLAPLARGEAACTPTLALALFDALARLERVAALPLQEPTSELTAPATPAAHSELEVYLLQADDEAASAGDLVAALAESGYRVQRFTDPVALRNACVAPCPAAALVLDLATHEAVAPAWALVKSLGAQQLPMVAALPSDDLRVRIGASRAGVSRTLTRPLEAQRLAGVLDMLTGRRPERPYRVLLVDDEPLLLAAQAAVLRSAGMVVQSLAEPLQTLEALDAFVPDVLLLDVYMPEVSGPELAAALRERDAWLDLPVLFLSAETDLTQQLLALNLGGDDFLVKPVQPDHLVAAVTARARRARQASALRERLQTMLYEREREHLALDHHAIVSIADREGRLTYANDLFCQISGYERQEVLGQSHRMLTVGQQEPGFMRAVWRSISAGKVWHGEIWSRRKDGSRYWVETTVTPFLDSAGEMYQFVAIQTDISHIKAAEARLRSQRDLQRFISEAAASLMAATSTQTQTAIHEALRQSGQQLGVDRAYLFRFAGARALDNTQVWCAPGLDPMDDRLKTTPVEATPWLREQFYRHSILVVPDVQALPPEAALDRARMEERQIRAFLAFPLKRNGQIFGFIGYSVMQQPRDWLADEIDLLKVLADVVASAVARKLAEAALRESEARLNFLVSSSPVVIYTREVQPPHAVAYVSPNVKQLMGFDPSSFMKDQRQGLDFVHPEDRERMLLELPLVLQQDVDLSEYRLNSPGGGERWVQDHRRLVRDADGRPQEIVGYWMDITERKRFEAELSSFNSELELRVEAQTRDVLASERLAQGTLDALSARVVILDEQGDIVAANRAWSGFFGGRTPASVGNYLRYCEERDQASGREAATHLAPGLRAVLSGVERSHMQEYWREIDGVSHWFVCRIERFGTDEQPRIVVSHEDITALKQAERAQLRSQRLESLGTLAGGVAHDLNNALAPVLMGMSILKEQYQQESKLFDMIQGSAQRGADMVRQLLTFAKGAEGERVSVCPEQVVRELERLMKGSFPKNIQLRVQSDVVLPTVVGDPTQLHQVLLNLCVNARDAMPDGGTLSLRAQSVELDAVYARSIPEAVAGRYLALRVSDTGTGIPPDILDRIFDPFFTTKGADKGTGLGLSTVLGIVKSHGGFVQVYSQPGEGTVFSVYLPTAASEANQVPAPASDLAEALRGHGETILFVDDEAAVREVGRTVLERLNYRPLLAKDGADGLVRAAEHRATLRAVVTDLHMPLMDGLAFVRALRRVLPDVPVVVASGRVDEASAAELLRHGVTRRLDKPFTEPQLARELKRLLGV